MTQKRSRLNQHAARRRLWRLDGTYERLLQEFDWKCGICQRTIDEVGRLDIDHRHTRGLDTEPRGLLCRGCNMRLGRSNEPDWHLAAARYLERTTPK